MKARSDSWLRNLPRERQEQIIEWCNTPADRDPDTDKAVPKTGGYHYARAQLAADGLKASVSTLSDFYSWYHLQLTFERADDFAKQIEELLTRKFPDIDPKKISEAGQLIFTLQAANARNAEEFREMEYLRVAKDAQLTKKLELELKTKVFQVKSCELFLKWSADEKAKQILASGATHAEKIEQLGRAMFEDWDEK